MFRIVTKKDENMIHPDLERTYSNPLIICVWYHCIGKLPSTSLLYHSPIDIESLQNRLLKVCYVPATSASLPRVSFFFSFLFLLLRPLTVLISKQGALKQSMFLDVYVFTKDLLSISACGERKNLCERD